MYRPQKVASIIKKSLSNELTEIGRKHKTTITITEVAVASDLKNATVWVSLYGSSQVDTMAQIEADKNRLRHKVAASSTAKFTPKLHFRQDTSAQHADRINRLLKG